jgi:hypothetical protein
LNCGHEMSKLTAHLKRRFRVRQRVTEFYVCMLTELDYVSS